MKLLLLHLSDIHLQNPQDAINQKINAVASAAASGEKAHACIIVVSGDMVYGGTKEEYGFAEDFLLELRNTLEQRLSLEEIPFVLIPGNHDCILKPENPVRETVIASIKAEPVKVNDNSLLENCMSVQQPYFDFVNFLMEKGNKKPHLFEAVKFKYGQYVVQFNCINTAWMSELKEKQGELLFPTKILPTQEECTSDVTITLLHHPYNWFRNDFSRELRSWVENNSDIILTGHEHMSDQYTKSRKGRMQNEYIEAGVLYDYGNPENSSFSTLLIDLDLNKQLLQSYSWSAGRYIRDTEYNEGWTGLQVKQLQAHGSFAFRPSFAEELDDPGASFTASFGEVKLSDIFLYPQLQEFKHLGNGKGRLSSEELIDRASTEPLLLIDGPDRSGKTSLAKQLVKDFKQQACVAVLLEGGRLENPEKALKAVERKFKEQYQSDLDTLWQLKNDERAVIIDDFHLSPLNARGKNLIVKKLHEKFGQVVVFAQNFTLLLEDIVSDSEDALLKNAATLKILQFGYELRGELVRKWLRPEDDFITDRIVLDNRLRVARETIDAILSRNFIPSYPFFVLTILQIMQSSTPLDTSSTSYGQGYFYEALVLKQLNQVTNNLDPSTKLTYLSSLAYYLFKQNKREISNQEIEEVHKQYCSVYKRDLSLDNLLLEFEQALILKVTPYGVRFRYGYLYCYFVAKHIAGDLEDSETEQFAQADVINLSKHVYREEFANILLFLTHSSRDRFVIDAMLTEAHSLYTSYEPAKLQGDIEFLNTLLKKVPELYYKNEDPDTFRKTVAREIDEMSNLSEDETEEEEKFDEDIILELNKAQKSLQILGQVLKNSPGSIKGDRKLVIARAIYDLGLRVTNGFNNLLDNHIDSLVRNLTEHILKKTPDVPEHKVVEGVQNLVFALSKLFTLHMLKAVTQSIGSEKLEEIYEELRTEGNSFAVDLIDVSIRLDHLSNYPLARIKDLKENMEAEKNLYALSLLQSIVLGNLQVFSHPTQLRQRVCSIVGVKFVEKPSEKVLPKVAKS